eukprot:scaffold22569_cov116-Cylindrotheca_fusiformis.AAC.4
MSDEQALKKLRMTSSNVESTEKDLIHLVVGGYHYSTTTDTLLNASTDGDSYFSTLLSGRWKRDKSQNIEIKDRNGSLFVYILLYLRHCKTKLEIEGKKWPTLLSRDEAEQLVAEAEYFGLEGLVTLIKEARDPLKGLEGTGDYDKSVISDFSLVACYFDGKNDYGKSLDMKYTYKGHTKICVRFSRTEYDDEMEVTAQASDEVGQGENYESSNRDISDIYELLQPLVETAIKNNNVSVVAILEQLDPTKVPPSVHLLYSFIITDMVYCYTKRKKFEADFINFFTNDSVFAVVYEGKSIFDFGKNSARTFSIE